MEDETIIKLQANPTDIGFDILPINAGEAKGHAITFSAAVLKSSLLLWDGLPCFLDHDYSGFQSVKNLAGALHAPAWNEQEQGIQAVLLPGRPGGRQPASLAACSQDPVGFSAHLYIRHKGGVVQEITKINSVDCVIDPARGGKFLQQGCIKPQLMTSTPRDAEKAQTRRSEWGHPPHSPVQPPEPS